MDHRGRAIGRNIGKRQWKKHLRAWPRS